LQIDTNSLSTEQLAALVSRLSNELTQRVLNTNPLPAATTAEWSLTADDVAERLCKSRRWVFRNIKKLPFARRVSRKAVVADEAGLNHWIANRPR
jgi:hypothetical protein